MSVSHLKPKSRWTSSRQLQTATLMLVGTLIISGLVAALWFAGEHRISQIFEQFNKLQQNPPMWLEAPMVTGKYLLAPTIALFIGVLAVMRVSPQPRTWSRRIVVSILIILTLRYVTWRSLSTLNLANPLNGVFSLGLFVLEMLMLASSTIQLFLMLNVKDRKRAADIKSQAVIDSSFDPTVE